MALGLATAMPAVVSGLWDFGCLPNAHRGERVAWAHLGSVSGALACILASVLVRWPTLGEDATPWPAVALAGARACCTLAAGWLGGELVFRHGMAVDRERTE